MKHLSSRFSRHCRLWGPAFITVAAFALSVDALAEPPSAPQFNPDRPGIANGSTLVGKDQFQIETGVQIEQHYDGATHLNLLYTPLLLRYGLSDHYELRVETMGLGQSRTTTPGADSRRTAGYFPVSLGMKYHFQDATPATHGVSLGSILRVFPRAGSSDFASQRLSGDLQLDVDWNLSSLWSINPNIGFGVYQDGTGRQFTTVLLPITVNYNVTPSVAVFAEPALSTPEALGGGKSVIYDGGVTYIFQKDNQLDFSVGTGVVGQTAPHPFVGFGYSHRF